MNRATWKRFEQRVGEILGGRRVPVSGRTRGDQPDVEHPYFSIECKLRKNPVKFLDSAFDQAEKSKRRDQVPLVVVGTANRDTHKAYAVLRLEDLKELYDHLVLYELGELRELDG